MGDQGDLAEWKAINRAYHGLDRRDRIDEFVRAMRRKHPTMPAAFEEQLAEKVRELKEDKDLARREGIPEEYIQD